VSISSRRKGKAAELEFAREMTLLLGVDVRRNLAQSRAGGHDLLALEPFAVEVKRCETLALPAWWRQTCAQAELAGLQPALAWRRSRQPWSVVVPLGCLHPDFEGMSFWRLEMTATLTVDGFAAVVREAWAMALDQ
jgi:hypothetical protein